MVEERSKFTQGLENYVIGYSQNQAKQFSERSECYHDLLRAQESVKKAQELDRFLSETRYLDTELTEIKKKMLSELSHINEKKKSLEDVLELGIILHHKPKGLDVVLPINYEEIERTGFGKRVYNRLDSVAGRSKTVKYNGLVVIKTKSWNLNRILKEIEDLNKEKDFMDANLRFRATRLQSLLEIPDEEVAKVTDIIPQKKVYTVRDIQQALGHISLGSTYRAIRLYLDQQGLLVEKGRRFKFSEEEFKAIIAFKSRPKHRFAIPEDLKAKIRTAIAIGKSPEEIFQEYKNQYGGPVHILKGGINLIKYNRKKIN